MGEPTVVATMFTEQILDLLCICHARLCAPTEEHLLFDRVTGRLASHSALAGTYFYSRYYCISTATTNKLNEFPLPGAGTSSLYLPTDPLRNLLPYAIDDTRRNMTKESNRSIYFLRPTSSPVSASSLDFDKKENSRNVGQINERQQLSFTTSAMGKPESVSFSAMRCSERGCVFPASSPRAGRCSYHLHQQEEPVLFLSHQPTGMLLDPARTAPAEKEYDIGRKRDRRRMAAIWEQFQSDGTP